MSSYDVVQADWFPAQKYNFFENLVRTVNKKLFVIIRNNYGC